LVCRPDLKLHLKPVRLQDWGPLKIVLPSHANSRRARLDTYFTTNGIKIERVIEMDSMMGTLDFISKSDWVTIVPALLMTGDIAGNRFTVMPIVEPLAPMDMVTIEPVNRVLTAAARTFLEIMREEANRCNNEWSRYFDGTRAFSAS
jgi:LysR family transcriptional regulator, nitrogen assimilation regulatory protein